MANPVALLAGGVGGAAVLGAGYGLWIIHKRKRAPVPLVYAAPPITIAATPVTATSAAKPVFATPAAAGLPGTPHPATALLPPVVSPHPAANAIIKSALAAGAVHPAVAVAKEKAPASPVATGVKVLPWHPNYDRIGTGETMHPGEARQTQHGELTLEFSNGALNLYDTRKGRTLLWSTGTKDGSYVTMQKDGNLVLYNAAKKAVWNTRTYNGDKNYLQLQADGNMVVYNMGDHKPYWDTNTTKFVKKSLTGAGDVINHGGFNVGEIAAMAVGVPPGVFTTIVTVDPGANKWVGNAVKTAGHAVESAAHAIQDESGKISSALSKIPVVGGLLHGLYDATFFAVLGPVMMTEQIVVEGQRIDTVALNELKAQLRDFKEVGPYAEMVCSLIPGIGTGIAAAIGVGLALANGQGIAEAVLAGVEAAVPGGPLAKMAFDVAQKSIVAAVEHKPLNWGLVASTGVEVVADVVNLPVPPEVQKMIEGGMTCASMLVQGKRIDKALIGGFADALPVGPEVKAAISDVTTMSVDLAQGRKIDQVLLDEVKRSANLLPVDDSIKKGLTAGIKVGFTVAAVSGAKVHGESPFGYDWFGDDALTDVPHEMVLSQRIQHVVTDLFLDRGKAGLKDKKAADAINIAIAVHQGKIVQDAAAPQFVWGGPVMTQLLTRGQDLLKTDAVVAAAYKTVTAGQSGFLIGAAAMRFQVNTHEFLSLRDNLPTGDDKKSFDTAVSMHIGRVANPPPKTSVDITAKAGYYTTLGVQGAQVSQKTAIVKTLSEASGTKTGTALAIKTVAQRRSAILPRILRAVGVRK